MRAQIPFPLMLSLTLLVACSADVGTPDGANDSALTSTSTFQNGVSPSSGYAGASDATILQNTPTTNASGGTVIADADYPDSSHKTAQGLLRFDLSSIPTGSTVTAVRLTLNVTNPTSGSYSLYRLHKDWTPSQVTWNQAESGHPWTTPGAFAVTDRSSAIMATFSPRVTGKTRIDFTKDGVAGVQVWVGDPSTNHGLVVYSPTNTDGVQFDGSKAATASRRPQLLVSYTPPSTTQPPPVAGKFAHPGILVGKAQLDFVKAKIAAKAEPWNTALSYALRSKPDKGANSGVPYSSSSWTPRPRATVTCGGYFNPDIGCYDQLNDSTAAYTNALLWYYTGERHYAQKAIQIMNAWSSTLKTISWNNGQYANGLLQAGWNGEIIPRAAEIIRYTYTPASGETAFNVAAFSTMLKNVFLPFTENVWTGGGANWTMTFAEATMNIGIFLDDETTFQKGVTMWAQQVPSIIYMEGDKNTLPGLAGLPISPPGTVYAKSGTTATTLRNYWHNPTKFISGLEGETCRDINHEAMGFAALINGAETARLQGVDLYGEFKDRIVAGMELNTGYDWYAVKGGQNPPPGWVCPNKVDTTNGAWKVTWEIGFNHFHNRLGVNMPNTSRMLTDVVRPSAWRTSGQMVDETLTHYGVP